MTEETSMGKDRVNTHENCSAPGEIITEYGLDSKQVEEDDVYYEDRDQVGKPVAEIHAGPLNLKIFEGGIIDYNGFEAQEFVVKGWREKFRILIWNDSGYNFVMVCDFEDVVGTEPKEIEFDGTYVDFVNLLAVKYEVFGWIICRDPMVIDYILKYETIRDALGAIKLILENRNRAYNAEIMKKIYPVFAMSSIQFKRGEFCDLVEKELTKDAVDLLPILAQIFVATEAIGFNDFTDDDLVSAISESGMTGRLLQ